MRKIERGMNLAISQYKNWRCGNTSVIVYEDESCVYLHENLIARVGENYITVYDGGVRSNTTKSRLNAILQGFGKPGEKVYQKNHEWRIKYDGKDEPFVSNHTL